ncbi:MAG TPA: hypothetical protein VI956_00785 [Nitrospirota bacterium]|nr:hypothetical protein [Nitrospirota bacterium]
MPTVLTSGTDDKGGAPPATGAAGGAPPDGGGAPPAVGDTKGSGAGANSGGSVGDGKGESQWLSLVPEDIRAAPSFAKFKDVGQLAASYLNLEKHVGSDKIAVPNPKNATEKDWENVFTKLGRPETPDKYEIKPTEGVDVKLDDGIMKGFREAAHKSGLLPGQVQNLFSWYSKAMSDQMKVATDTFKNGVQKGLDDLKTEWGEQYKPKIGRANLALKEFGDDALTKFFEESGMGNHPALIKVFAKIGEGLSEDKFRGDQTAHIGLSIEAAEKELLGIMGDSKHAYYNKDNAQHDYFVKHVAKLNEQVATGRRK